MLEVLRGNDVAGGPIDTLLAACHADAELAEPTESALLLAGDETLTVEEIQRLGPATAPLRLALLTACRTAQPGATLPDETINLPTALLRAGCAAGVGTLWAVPARTAALFAGLFARQWLDRDLDPAAATRAAVDELRTIDYAGERAVLGDTTRPRGMPSSFRAHAHPARWAAFICGGW